VLGSTPDPATEEAPINPVEHVSWRPNHEADDLRPPTRIGCAPWWCVPVVVYGGGDGIVGDLFKSASNGLVRVVGDGNNHWPLVYDRDSGGPVCAACRA